MSTPGLVFKIQRHSLHDGAGIRTLVFLKGCPLHCWWCFNPESQKTAIEILHDPEKCIQCGSCLEVCGVPEALSLVSGRISHDPSFCSGCGDCVDACPAASFIAEGTCMSPGEVVDIVVRDKVFYDKSGGGVTLSGGEVSLQAGFSSEVLRLCGTVGIHTAIETCGYCLFTDFEKILKHTDLVLYDLKLIDSGKHRRYTGVDNRIILENLTRTADSGIPYIVRIPIIPGCNDDEEDVRLAVDFLSGLKNLEAVHLLPYEMFGMPKYERLGRSYRLPDLLPPEDHRMKEIQQAFLSGGWQVQIGG